MKLFTTAIAAAALMTAADAKGFNGFYAGADVGMSNDSTKFVISRHPAAVVGLQRAANSHSKRTSLGLILGYNKLFSSCLTVGALFTSDFNFGGKKTLHSSEEYTFKNKKGTYSWGLYATGGMLINPKTSLFVGLGVKSLKYRVLYTEKDANGGSGSFKNNSVRFSVLAGLETLFANDTMSVRLTYGITPGKNKKANVNQTNVIFNDAAGPGSYKSKITEQQVKIGIAYRF